MLVKVFERVHFFILNKNQMIYKYRKEIHKLLCNGLKLNYCKKWKICHLFISDIKQGFEIIDACKLKTAPTFIFQMITHTFNIMIKSSRNFV